MISKIPCEVSRPTALRCIEALSMVKFQIIADLALKMGSVGAENCAVFQVFDVKALYVFLTNRLIEMLKTWQILYSTKFVRSLAIRFAEMRTSHGYQNTRSGMLPRKRKWD